MKPLQVNLAEETHEKLDRIKQRKGLSKSEIGRRGIIEQIRKLEG